MHGSFDPNNGWHDPGLTPPVPGRSRLQTLLRLLAWVGAFVLVGVVYPLLHATWFSR